MPFVRMEISLCFGENLDERYGDDHLSQSTVFESLQMAAIVAQQIKRLQLSKTILIRPLRFIAMVTSFENMMVSLLDDCFRCILVVRI